MYNEHEPMNDGAMNEGYVPRREFSDEVMKEFNPETDLSGLSRRKFLALLGASTALVAAGCSDYPDKGEIVPYNKKQDDILPGIPNYYASTCTACSLNCGILIKTREGRPIKIDGNPDHPINNGKTCVKGQAHILNLYDPSRITEPFQQRNGKEEMKWKDIDDIFTKAFKNAGQKEISIVTSPVTSPTFKKLLDDLTAVYPTAKIYSYEQFSDNNRRSAWKQCYGSENIPMIEFEKAKVILALDADFLGVEGNPVQQTQDFIKTRGVERPAQFSRLYAAEANMSLTGMNADIRLRVSPHQQFEFALALIYEVSKKLNVPVSSPAITLQSVAKKFDLNLKILEDLVNDLTADRNSAIVIPGRSLDIRTNVAVNQLNELLGAQTLYSKRSFYNNYYPSATYSDLEQLVNKMNAGQVAAMIIIDSNPVYTLPADLGFESALKKLSLTAILTEFENETSSAVNFVLPIHHTLEAWGDSNVFGNVYSTQQPVIAPLYNTRQKEAALLVWLQQKSEYNFDIYHSYLKQNWEKNIFPNLGISVSFERFWLSLLHDGVILKTVSSDMPLIYNASAFQNVSKQIADSKGVSLCIRESYKLQDGRYAQNGWLQELPHPVSKSTWDNHASISRNTAEKFSLETNDLIEISTKPGKIEIPVLIQPGLADNHISIDAGYGRIFGATVAIAVGTNVNTLLTKSNAETPFLMNDISIRKIGTKHPIAGTQDHYDYKDDLIKDIHRKREIVREGTVLEYMKNRNFLRAEKKELGENMYEEFQYKDVKWAMSIDLNKCTGCAQCSLACSVENNIPVVGRDQVLVNREMQWMRLDRYYSGTPEDPLVSIQPMLCQHCDQAPCENVCPVVATNHSPDGLNQMVYNRCVGTRYCSNNCPYKVRRFNFFNFRDHFADGHYQQPVMTLAANPEVTVRSRGVMEKCTFCVHRISEGRAEAARSGEKFTGAGITSACQDACPTNAIIFGNVNDAESAVAKNSEHNLGYSVLEELNIRPNVTYIAKLRNIQSEEVK